MYAGVVSAVSATVLTLTNVSTTFTAGTGTHTVQGDDGTDVLGVNITMWAGLGLLTGGIGTRANYLETDVDVAGGGTGALNAYDRLAATTDGIYLNETHGALRIDTVWTKADASLTTRAGSIVDARNDGAANVIATNIDLDANGSGSSIGDPAGSNDLKIESSHSASGDVGMEADQSIYVTEVRGTAGARPGRGAQRRHPDHRPRDATTTTPSPASAGTYTGPVTFNGASLTRDSGSFVTDGFKENTALQITGGTPYDGWYTIAAVTALTVHAHRRASAGTPGVASDRRTNVTLTGAGTLDENLDLLHDGSVALRRERRSAPCPRDASRPSTARSCSGSATT